jgi:hypothetical protein
MPSRSAFTPEQAADKLGRLAAPEQASNQLVRRIARLQIVAKRPVIGVLTPLESADLQGIEPQRELGVLGHHVRIRP